MLKETFKMRKIGKHLVNVSMLSLATYFGLRKRDKK